LALEKKWLSPTKQHAMDITKIKSPHTHE
jgi:hypothetical protein